MFFKSTYLRQTELETLTNKVPSIFAEQPHERTSDRYLFISTEKMLRGLTNNGWSIVSAVQSGNRASQNMTTNKHAVMLCRTDMLGQSFNVNDIMPLLKIENSHNGLSSFSISTAIFRKVCANGLTVPDTILAAPKIKHTKEMVNEVIEASYTVIKEFPQLVEQINAMKSVNLNKDEQRLLVESASRLIFNDDQIKRTNDLLSSRGYSVEDQLLKARRSGDLGQDLWSITNVIQENAIRGNVKLVGETGKVAFAKQVKSIDRDTKINTELMTLAQKMAELKGIKIAA